MKQRTKRNVRRMLSIILILLMCISLATPAFAAEGSPGIDESIALGQLSSDGEDSANSDGNPIQAEITTEDEEQPEGSSETVELETGTEGEKQSEVEESEKTEGDEQLKDEISTVIQEFLDAVEAVLNFGEVADENAEEYHALYEAAMTAYEAVKAEELENDERVVAAKEQLEEKGDVQPKDDGSEIQESEETNQTEGEESEKTEGDEQLKDEISTVIQEFLDAADAVLNFGEVTDENAEEYHSLYEVAMTAYEAVKAEGLESDERVVVAMAELESKGDEQPKDEVPAIIQEFLDAVEAVVNFGEVADENAEEYHALYEAAMKAYEAVKAEGLENDERVVAAKEQLEELLVKVEENSNTFEVSNMEELADAIATINSSAEGSYTISLKSSFAISDSIANGNGKRLAFGHGSGSVKRDITILGNGNTITFSTAIAVNFEVEGNGTVLNLGNGSDSLIIQGTNGVHASTAIFTAYNGGTINMYSNVVLRDSSSLSFTGGGGAIALQSNATFNMYGGTISNCSANALPYGGGVSVDAGTFNMHGGVIEKCSVNGYGGGVFVWPEGTFNMSGTSTIKDCNAIYGGGVFIYEGGRFTMNDSASITNNNADCGGGVCLGSGSIANVTSIYNNTAREAGDDIFAENSTNLTLSLVGTNWILNSTGLPITNWYYDGYRETVDDNGEAVCDETRWNVSDVEEECYLYEYTTPANNVTVALKAAHGIAGKVTVTYKDAEGNVIGEPETQIKGSEFTVKAALESTADKEFDYWSGDDGNTYKPGDTVTPETDLVLTAVMKAKKSDYTVE